MTRTSGSSGSCERPRIAVLEGLAVLSAGLGIAPHIWWVGFTFAAVGVYLVWSRPWRG